MTRHSKREIERAVDGMAGDRNRRPSNENVTDAHRVAVVHALGYRYENYGDVAGNPDGSPEEQRAFFLDAAEHIEEPHASVLREWFGREDAEA